MIDTVKISIPYTSRPEWLEKASRYAKYHSTSGVFTAIIYPSKSFNVAGLYLPQLQYIEQPATSTREKNYSLNIEVSLPKLYFGNNFNELRDDLFPGVVSELSSILKSVWNLVISTTEIENAIVRRIDYSKNIIYTNRTPVSTIIGAIRNADISKTYDVQQTVFKNGGQIYHIHTNSMDIVMYDKIADLRQSKITEKRSHEKNNYSQLELLDEFEKHKNVSVARLEIRLNGRQKIRSELKKIGIANEMLLKHLFSSEISRKILILHWENIFNLIPKLAVTETTTSHLLTAYMQDSPEMKFAEASALVLIQQLRFELKDEREFRNIIEGLFGTGQYYRMKKLCRDPPNKTQLKDLLHISETVMKMQPVTITDLIE